MTRNSSFVSLQLFFFFFYYSSFQTSNPMTPFFPLSIAFSCQSTKFFSLQLLTQRTRIPAGHSCSWSRVSRRSLPPWSSPDGTTCTRSVSSSTLLSPCPPFFAEWRIPVAASPSLRWSGQTPRNDRWSPHSWTRTNTGPGVCWISPTLSTGLHLHPGRRYVLQPRSSWGTCKKEDN